MTPTYETKLEITSWDEQPLHESADGTKVTRASVSLGAAEGFGSSTYEGLMYYRSDGTSSYVTLMQVTATLDGKSGSFALQGDGTYDGTTASGRFTVIEGSGTGELAGIAGTAESVSTQADYPMMPLTFELALE